MKKILFVASIQDHINAFHLPFIKELQENGYEVHVACKLNRDYYKKIEKIDDGIVWKNVDFTRNPISKSNLKTFKQLINYMRKYNFEFIHTHTPTASFISRYAAKKTNTKSIYTAHGFHFYKGAPLLNWILYCSIERVAAKWSNAIITMNEEDYTFAKRKLESEMTSVYKVNGVGLDINKYNISDYKDIKFKEYIGLNKDDFIITVVAELIPRKNHKQILQSIKPICKRYKDIKLLIVGDGALYEEIESYIEENYLTKNVLMLGNRNDVPKLLNISDVVGLFSYQEGLPRNIMEAMAAKKPIICTKIRGNIDLVEHNRNGIVVETNDIEATIAAIEKLYVDEQNRVKMGEESFELIKRYCIENVLVQMRNIYKEVLVNE